MKITNNNNINKENYEAATVLNIPNDIQPDTLIKQTVEELKNKNYSVLDFSIGDIYSVKDTKIVIDGYVDDVFNRVFKTYEMDTFLIATYQDNCTTISLRPFTATVLDHSDIYTYSEIYEKYRGMCICLYAAAKMNVPDLIDLLSN